MTDFSCAISILLPCSINEAFSLLTNPDKIEEWGGGESICEPKAGGKFMLFDGWVEGEVLIYEPNKTLSYTWVIEDWESSYKPSIVRYDFTDDNGSARIELSHTNFPNQEEATNHKEGWYDHVLNPIMDYLQDIK